MLHPPPELRVAQTGWCEPRVGLSALLLAIGLLAGACGDSTDNPVPGTTSEAGNASDPGETGDPGSEVTVAGADSGSVGEETASAEAPDWARERPDGHVAIARAVDVTDGDSLRVEINGRQESIRLIGLNANEGGDCFGDEAGQFVDSVLSDGEFEVITPSTDPDDPAWIDDFDRLLRFVYVDGELLNYRLIVDGWAVARAQSDHPFTDRFEAAETEASAAGRGLWAADACGIATSAVIEIADYEPNAPGPDDENRNGEWVELRNGGDSDASMGGWVLRDESTRHRFDFPEGFVLAPGASVRVFSGAENEPLSDDYRGNALYWDDPAGSVWNNGGDTIFVLDPSGNVVVSERYEG